MGLVAVALGLTSVGDPALALELSLGLPFVLLVFSDLASAVGLFVLSQFLLPNTGALAKVTGLLLLTAALLRTPDHLRRRADLVTEHPLLCALAAVSVVWVGLSVSWAADGSIAASNALRYAQNAALFVIVFAAVHNSRDAKVILGAFALGAALSAAYGLVGAANITQPGRLVGTTGEANQLATYLVAGLVVSIGLALTSRRTPPLVLGASTSAAACILGLALTLSRAGLIALVAALIASTVVVRRYRGVITLAGVLVAGGFAVYFLALAPPQARQRIFYDPSGTSGRTALWTVARRMIAAHPLDGIGIGNFPLRSVDFLVRPGVLHNDSYVVEQPLEAHNIYLQLLAETGVVGFLLFASIVLTALRSGWRAARARLPASDRDLAVLAEATLVATVAVLVANFFAPGLFDKQMWLLFALGPALWSLAREHSPRPADARTRVPAAS